MSDISQVLEMGDILIFWTDTWKFVRVKTPFASPWLLSDSHTGYRSISWPLHRVSSQDIARSLKDSHGVIWPSRRSLWTSISSGLSSMCSPDSPFPLILSFLFLYPWTPNQQYLMLYLSPLPHWLSPYVVPADCSIAIRPWQSDYSL